MTCNVFGGTLNLALSIYLSICFVVLPFTYNISSEAEAHLFRQSYPDIVL